MTMAPNEPTDIARAETAEETAWPSFEEGDVIRLSIEDQIALAEAILNPSEPNEALRKAAQAYKRLVVVSR
ncbi:DUF1778 domain-containing protein [Mesorhizobium opportunistum]|uniref:DUF1778 domain-containing protein n=1 Tax=Mesorhizobium opportunistum TaxID=593909 RepID=A0ABV1YR34_9HYPH|nr:MULTISPECIES: DUF1778 domain-containing protein [Mesorhizobium]TIN91636.1 MAG: DUF1778 domain-containing protein [Mesorhizobium sp.]TJU94447.1 MAG: DUF1778 domain-containing protein [Mesorhizobium sp.]TJV14011.1 MAG: DUF1778 domain-containing protein [Mesorhizobium sp.]TJV40538.1 MAG: DUF1778 domain-containing protein [Mesorhizobium sp.]WJI39496.1 DUF1778 domain-containing protein [Mesorhizobium opportunistum]